MQTIQPSDPANPLSHFILHIVSTYEGLSRKTVAQQTMWKYGFSL